MKLIYHKGKNFGDAINPLIFENLLPDFFSPDSKYEFLGIGSILGLKRPSAKTKKIIVFSSGFAGGDINTYGKLPNKEELKKYDIRCVRGPLTAQALGIAPELGVCDGAILLPEVAPYKNNKEYKFSYIPHLGSLVFFSNWRSLLENIDIHLIDPTEDVNFIINEIQKTEIIITEAMHGAIVADAYRIPWIPIISNKTINEFKWNDFCRSLDLEYKPQRMQTLFDESFLEGIAKNKLSPINSKFVNKQLAKGYSFYQRNITEREVKKQLRIAKQSNSFLSSNELFGAKKEILLEKLFTINKDYSNKLISE